MSQLYPNSAMFWYTGATLSNQRGALMGHLPGDEGHVPFYIGYVQRDEIWRVSFQSGELSWNPAKQETAGVSTD